MWTLNNFLGQEEENKKDDNSLINPNKAFNVFRESLKKTLTKTNNDILGKNEEKLLTNDGRELLNENIEDNE